MCRVGILGYVWLDAQSFYETPHKWWQTSHLACLTTLSLRPLGDTSKNLTFLYRITWSLQAQTLLRVLHGLYHQISRELYFNKDQDWKEGIFLGYQEKQSDSQHGLQIYRKSKSSGWEWSQYPKKSYNNISTQFLHSQQYSKRNKNHKPINSYRLVYSFHCWGSLFERLLL